MPQIQSAKKRLRQNDVRRVANQALRTRVKSTRRAFIEIEAGEDAEAIQAAYRTYCSVLDKAAKAGVISRNTAIRRKGRAANRIRVPAAAAPAEKAPVEKAAPAEETSA